MKRSILVLTLALLLTGCSGALNSTYVSIAPHQSQTEVETAVVVQSYLSLRSALLEMISQGTQEETLKIYDYSGDLGEDLEVVTYELSNNDPLGTYATSAINYTLSFVMSHYEVNIHISYRRTPGEIAGVESLSSEKTLEDRMYEAMENYEHKVVVREPFFTDVDLEGLVLDYYKSFPTDCMQLPQVTVNTYPDRGFVRVVEVFFNYNYSTKELALMSDAVSTGVATAAEYVRYRPTRNQKIQLLYNYLSDRFTYTWDETDTPVYSFLCEGVAGSDGAARALDAICKKLGISSTVVEGTKGDTLYTWNIIQLDEGYRHVDLLGCLLRGEPHLEMFYDKDMAGYTWNKSTVPACAPPLASLYPVAPVVE